MNGKRTKHKDKLADVTGKELTETEEITVMLDLLIEELDRKGIIDRKEYNRLLAMRLHEISKARAFEELNEEI
jgi:hypothetical protein